MGNMEKAYKATNQGRQKMLKARMMALLTISTTKRLRCHLTA